MMKKFDKKLIIIPIIIILAGAAMFTIWWANKPDPKEGMKAISITILSERDDYEESFEDTTDLEYLGDYLAKNDIIDSEDSSYGRFITGVKSMAADNDNQYWWCVIIDGESATVSIDEIVITDGIECTLELKQGY